MRFLKCIVCGVLAGTAMAAASAFAEEKKDESGSAPMDVASAVNDKVKEVVETPNPQDAWKDYQKSRADSQNAQKDLTNKKTALTTAENNHSSAVKRNDAATQNYSNQTTKQQITQGKVDRQQSIVKQKGEIADQLWKKARSPGATKQDWAAAENAQRTYNTENSKLTDLKEQNYAQMKEVSKAKTELNAASENLKQSRKTLSTAKTDLTTAENNATTTAKKTQSLKDRFTNAAAKTGYTPKQIVAMASDTFLKVGIYGEQGQNINKAIESGDLDGAWEQMKSAGFSAAVDAASYKIPVVGQAVAAYQTGKTVGEAGAAGIDYFSEKQALDNDVMKLGQYQKIVLDLYKSGKKEQADGTYSGGDYSLADAQRLAYNYVYGTDEAKKAELENAYKNIDPDHGVPKQGTTGMTDAEFAAAVGQYAKDVGGAVVKPVVKAAEITKDSAVASYQFVTDSNVRNEFALQTGENLDSFRMYVGEQLVHKLNDQTPETKQAISDKIKQQLMKEGMSEEQANRAAKTCMEKLNENFDDGIDYFRKTMLESRTTMESKEESKRLEDAIKAHEEGKISDEELAAAWKRMDEFVKYTNQSEGEQLKNPWSKHVKELEAEAQAQKESEAQTMEKAEKKSSDQKKGENDEGKKTDEGDPKTTEGDPKSTEGDQKTTEGDQKTTEGDQKTTEGDQKTTEGDPKTTEGDTQAGEEEKNTGDSENRQTPGGERHKPKAKGPKEPKEPQEPKDPEDDNEDDNETDNEKNNNDLRTSEGQSPTDPNGEGSRIPQGPDGPSLSGFLGKWLTEQGQKFLENNNLNQYTWKEYEQAIQNAIAKQNAQQTISQGGEAANQILTDSANATANAQQQNSWGKHFGDALEQSITAGLTSLGTSFANVAGENIANELLKGIEGKSGHGDSGSGGGGGGADVGGGGGGGGSGAADGEGGGDSGGAGASGESGTSGESGESGESGASGDSGESGEGSGHGDDNGESGGSGSSGDSGTSGNSGQGDQNKSSGSSSETKGERMIACIQCGKQVPYGKVIGKGFCSQPCGYLYHNPGAEIYKKCKVCGKIMGHTSKPKPLSDKDKWLQPRYDARMKNYNKFVADCQNAICEKCEEKQKAGSSSGSTSTSGTSSTSSSTTTASSSAVTKPYHKKCGGLFGDVVDSPYGPARTCGKCKAFCHDDNREVEWK